MSRTTTTTLGLSLVLGLALVGASAVAWAQPGPGGPPDDFAEAGPWGPGKGLRGRHAIPLCLPKGFLERMTPFDLDKNGWIDPEEHEAMRQAHRRDVLARYDKDGDGSLSAEERATLRHERRVERFETMDENGDAAVSRAEAIAACTPLAWRFDALDTNKNGLVEWTEFEAAAQQRRMYRRGRRGMRGRGLGGPGPGPGWF